MSHADGSVLGLEHGKIGDRIAVVLDGKQIYKKLYKPTNPRTPKQQMHRAKLAFVNRLSKVLAEAVNMGFAKVPVKGSCQSPRNAFVKANWDNGSIVWAEREHGRVNGAEGEEREHGRVNGAEGEEREPSQEDGAEVEGMGAWELCPERLEVAKGPRYISRSIAATIEEGVLHVTCCDTGMTDVNAVGDDQLHVAVYWPATQTTMVYAGPLRKECGECYFELPEESLEKGLLVYAWFQATKYHRANGGKTTVRPGQASDSVFLGSFLTN